MAGAVRMLEKATSQQHDVAPSGTVLNVYRHPSGTDELIGVFTPRSLGEHEHSTLQVSVLLRETIASVGWQTGGGKAAARRLRGGQAYIVPSGQPHDFHYRRPQGMVNFHIAEDAFVALCPALLECSPSIVDEATVIESQFISSLAAELHSTASTIDDMARVHIDAAWTMLVVHVARLSRSSEAVSAALKGSLPTRRLARVLDHIDARISEPDLRVSDLAAVAGLSPVHFSRLFTRAVGSSPLQFVIACRLERARELLRKDQTSIAAIALATGFGSHSRLTEAFRRHFGKTPTAFRQGR